MPWASASSIAFRRARRTPCLCVVRIQPGLCARSNASDSSTSSVCGRRMGLASTLTTRMISPVTVRARRLMSWGGRRLAILPGGSKLFGRLFQREFLAVHVASCACFCTQARHRRAQRARCPSSFALQEKRVDIIIIIVFVVVVVTIIITSVGAVLIIVLVHTCLLYTSPSPRD